MIPKVTEFGIEVKETASLASLLRKNETTVMIPAPLPANEAERLAALRSYKVLDTDFEKEYDDLCRLAAVICESPIALISFIDRDRQWFKASFGLDVRETARDLAFCAHALEQVKVFEVPDATKDVRFADNPLVTGEPDIRFYAGQPLVTPEGLVLGTLCSIDRVPRKLKPHQRDALEILASQVVTHLELRRTLAERDQLIKDKDDFLSIIAHDLRSPFSGLLGLTDLLVTDSAGMDKAEIVEYVGMISQSLHRVYDLSENLLKWALLEQGKMTFQPEEFPVQDLFAQVAAPMKETLGQKNLSLEIDVPQGLAVVGDRNMLETVLRNLVGNAVKFTQSGGRIWLAAKTGDSLKLSVKDTGQGMTAEQLDLVMSGLRTQSRRGTEGEMGTGLGLTLVRQFAARHGGRLEIESEEGKGTLATVILPL